MEPMNPVLNAKFKTESKQRPAAEEEIQEYYVKDGFHAHSICRSSISTVGWCRFYCRLIRGLFFWLVGVLMKCMPMISAQEKIQEKEVRKKRSVEKRWRIMEVLDSNTPEITNCSVKQQKVVVDLTMAHSYRVEESTTTCNYVVRVELMEILWDSNMFCNEDFCRGWFIDNLQVQFQPLWSSTYSGGLDDLEEVVARGLYPPSMNAAAYSGVARQKGVTAYISPRNPSLALSAVNISFRHTSDQLYVCNWERGEDGEVVSWNWSLNLWCPSGNVQYPDLYNARRWSGFKAVPALHPNYARGSFYGLEYRLRVEWVAPAATVKAAQVRWRVIVRAHLSCVRGKKHRWFRMMKKQCEEKWVEQSMEWAFDETTSALIDN